MLDKGDAPGIVLTRRQREILRLLITGMEHHEIAARLGISTRTVDFHVYTLFERLEVHGVMPALWRALEWGLLTRNDLPVRLEGGYETALSCREDDFDLRAG